jgi:hypothetical protein
MSYKPYCDLCDSVISAEIHERGIMNKCQYCGECIVKVDHFRTERSAHHDKIVAEWNAGLIAIRAVAGLADDARLPD